MANASFCIIHRYKRWEEILASERALQCGWMGCDICVAQPIVNVIGLIWEILLPRYLFTVTSTHFGSWRFYVFSLWGLVGCWVSWSYTFALRVTCAWPKRNWRHSFFCTGRTGPLLNVMTKPPFIFCLSFPRTAHCYQTYPCLKSFIIKNNGSSCGHGAWNTVFIHRIFAFFIIFRGDTGKCFAVVLTKLLAHVCVHKETRPPVRTAVWWKTCTKESRASASPDSETQNEACPWT